MGLVHLELGWTNPLTKWDEPPSSDCCSCGIVDDSTIHPSPHSLLVGPYLWDLHPSEAEVKCLKLLPSMAWFKGESAGKSGFYDVFYHQIQGFPVSFPILQVCDSSIQTASHSRNPGIRSLRTPPSWIPSWPSWPINPQDHHLLGASSQWVMVHPS